MQVLILLALVPLATAVSYGHPAHGFGGSYGGYGGHGYGKLAPKPQANCSVEDVHESAQVCVPTLETTCNAIKLVRKAIVDKEQCYDVTRTVCTESAEDIDNEICTYSYQPKTETTSAQNVEVFFQKECDTQMVTMCDTVKSGYGHGYGKGYGTGYGKGYGHGYGNGYGNTYGKGYKQVCKQVEQETCRNVPVVTPVQPSVDVTYPEPIETCVNKPISLPRISCDNLTEKKCIKVPEVETVTDSVDLCETKLGRPACQDVELTLPQQECVEMVYGVLHDKYEEPTYEETKYEEEPNYEEVPQYEEPAGTEEPAYHK